MPIAPKRPQEVNSVHAKFELLTYTLWVSQLSASHPDDSAYDLDLACLPVNSRSWLDMLL